jgi:hypothetical protein
MTLKKALAYLGKDYTTKMIDLELCLYRDLGNGRDIEISGIVHSRNLPKRICNFICVWDHLQSIEYVRCYDRSTKLETLEDLKQELDRLVAKYGGERDD